MSGPLRGGGFDSHCRRRAFAVAGPTVWKSLPKNVRDPEASEDITGSH